MHNIINNTEEWQNRRKSVLFACSVSKESLRKEMQNDKLAVSLRKFNMDKINVYYIVNAIHI